MSKPGFSFGLKKAGPAKAALPKRARLGFGADDDDREDKKPGTKGGDRTEAIAEFGGFEARASALDSGDGGSKSRKTKPGKGSSQSQLPPSRKPRDAPVNTQIGDLSSSLEARKHAQAAEAQDVSIYEYDGVYDSFKTEPKARAAEDADRRPKYFDALQRAADVRERDKQIAEERRLKRERDAEGDEFADKEKFVTEAYRKQQEENRRLEEEEKKREAEDAKKNKGRGMFEFMKQRLEQEDKIHAEKVRAAEAAAAAGPAKQQDPGEATEKTDADLAREINEKGGRVTVNEDGEVVDKRELLTGGLNVGAKKKADMQQDKARRATEAKPASQSRGVYAPGGKQAMRDRQTRMIEAQIEESLKRQRDEEEVEAQKIELASKSRKTEADVSSAKERYLARKRAAEEAKKNGLDEVP